MAKTKKSCKYFDACGTADNCARCEGFARRYENKIVATAICPSCKSYVSEIDRNTGKCEPCFKSR